MEGFGRPGDEAMRGLLEARLAPGEHILWFGRPSLRRRLDGRTIYYIAAAWIWIPLFGAFATWKLDLLGGALPLPAVISWYAVLVLVFLQGTVQFPATRLWYQRRTAYALTDRRVLELVTDAHDAARRFRSQAIELVTDEHLRLRTDGAGTIDFRTGPRRGGDPSKGFPFVPETIVRRRFPYISFVEVEDAADVLRRFTETRDRIRGKS